MSPAALALQFPVLDSADAEWGEEQELAETHVANEKERRLAALRNGLRIGQPDGHPTSIDALRAEVALVVAGGKGAGPAWPTGVAALDAALGGGVPRGRVTEVVGPMGAGKTSLVRQLVARVLNEGGWVAWVDATRTLAPQDLAGLGERLIIVRPHDHTRGAWCSDLLLRSGVFALVVLDGAPVLSRTVGVRLSQLARERDAAFVVLREGTQGSRLGGAVRLQVKPQLVRSSTAQASNVVLAQTRSAPVALTSPSMQSRVQWRERRTPDRKFSVLVEKGGSYRTVEVTCAIVMARRVCADTEIPDRRGVARRARAAGGTGSEHVQPLSGAAAATASVTGAERGHAFVFPSTGKTGRDTNRDTIAAAVDTGGHTNSGRKPDESWKKGRGRPRMAESTYGRITRRGNARKFLSNREHAAQHDNTYERKQRVAESDTTSVAASGKHTQPINRQQERRESRRQSRAALKQYAAAAGTLG